MSEVNDKDYVSTTMLAKSIQLKGPDLAELLLTNGWTYIEGKHRLLTDKGLANGGQYKFNDKGEKWAVWPLSLTTTTLFQNEILGAMTQVKRKFKLPGVDELNKDQKRVLRLPEDGQFLIIGGPGTGKSVVALLRTMKYHDNNDYAFLTFNKVLLTATKQLVDLKLDSFTLDSWFGKQYWKAFERNVPDITYRKPDYDKIMKELEEKGIEEKSFHIIIDEGQDKPIKFYETLMYLGIENFFIVADQNQQITEDNSSREELTNVLNKDLNDVIELTENWRNSYQIALLANEFYTDPSSPPPTLPSSTKASLGTPILYKYNDYQDCANLILREADRDNRNLIGVVVANDDKREAYVNILEKTEINLDNPKPIISTYFAEDNKVPNINFAYSGIVVLNDKSIKGLEFDIVFIVIDGFQVHNNDFDSMKKRFYVMSSRAIKKLVLLQSEQYKGSIEEILPKEDNVLTRKSLNGNYISDVIETGIEIHDTIESGKKIFEHIGNNGDK